MIASQALAEFQSYRNQLVALQEELCAQLRCALEEAGIMIHSLSTRLKSPDSLVAKLTRPDKTYDTVWQVTDLVGLRVTTYFEDAIPEVARVLENSFNIDFSHTQDRLNFADVVAFGYRSLHYVAGLQDNGSGLPPEFRFEIQVRTILQHAWAEIEHDLGYKASDTTPETIRRRFARIAGLLELADQEFVSIRRDLRRYADTLPSARLDQPFPLDRLSLQALVEGSAVSEADRRIARSLGKPLADSLFYPEYLLKMLRLAGFRDTREVHRALQDARPQVLAMVTPYFEFAGEVWRLHSCDLAVVPRGYALFFLSHAAVLNSTILEHNKVAKLALFYRELDYPDDEESAHRVAEGLVQKLTLGERE